jgi:small-conductance mechanosensitive channel
MNDLKTWLEQFGVINVHLFKIGDADVSLFDLLGTLGAIIALFWFAGWLQRQLVNRLLTHAHMDSGTRQIIGTLVRWTVLVVGTLLILQAAGINLTTFNVLAGALGVGLGFGLQEIFKNFVSGLIIMFGRPISIGDHIQVAGVEGEVVDIGIRCITLATQQDSQVIVPNSKLITENVVNVRQHGGKAPVVLHVNVARDANLQTAERVMQEVLHADPGVQKEPQPYVGLVGPPANGAFPFELRAWTNLRWRDRDELANRLYFSLTQRFDQAGVKLA